MDINSEQLIEELFELVAQEKDSTQLRNLLGQLIECLDARQRERERRKTNLPPEPRST